VLYLLAKTARDVAEDVLDLVAEDNQDHDHDYRDQDENEGVLYHALPFLTVEQLTETKIQAGQHAIHLLCDVLYAARPMALALDRTQSFIGAWVKQRADRQGIATHF
jgi:hypothetical protein